jgi:hypothetical protein
MNLAKPVTSLSMILGASSLFAAACSSSSAPSPTRDTASEAAALDAPNGGLNLASKEAPAFGDPEVEALPIMDDALVTRIAPTSLANAAASAPNGTPYRLALVWGHLPPAHDADVTDIPSQTAEWNGSVHVEGGGIGLLRTIAFGAGDRLEPMTSPQAFSFSSQTDAYLEGVLVRVIIPQGTAPTLHFATSLLSVDIDLSKLGDGPGGIVRAADGASAMAWFGFPEDLCARGFVLGRWVKDEPKLGRSFATVSDENGALIGYARGGWGYTPARSGEVWFAKYVDTAGNPRGLGYGWYGTGFLRGLWGATDEHDVDALRIGPLEGFYSDADDTGDGRGVWLGRWSGACRQ